MGPRLAGGLVALAVFPVQLATRGLPGPLEAVVFGWMILPTLAVYYLSRTGCLEQAYLVGSLVLTGLNKSLRILGIVMTMYDSRSNLSAQVVSEVKRHYTREICETLVPRSVRLSEAPSYGLPVTHHDPHSAGAEAYFELAKEVAARG